MDESQFWLNLEFRICHEFTGMPERRLQYFWCDGLAPSQYILDTASPRIIGTCWICNGDRQMNCEFALLLPHSISSPDEIPWGALLPAANVTRWMSFDERRGYLEIEPAVAVPDRA